MLEVNITLLVQMAHFLIAYVIMRALFVKDAVRIVIAREKTHDAQYAQIKLEHETIEKKNEEQHALLQYLKEEASAKMPLVEKEEQPILPVDELKERCLRASCDMEETDAIIESVSQKLTQRIEHV